MAISKTVIKALINRLGCPKITLAHWFKQLFFLSGCLICFWLNFFSYLKAGVI